MPDELPADPFLVEVRRDLRIPTSDPDVTLSADAYLPVGAGPVPALLTLIPYRTDLLAGGVFYQRTLSRFAAWGYACLLVNLRGIGASDGEPRPKMDPGEGDDGVAAIEWLAAQPWCSGRVGMWGCSSGGATTLRTASRRPAALKAIIAIECPLDPGREAFHHDGARVDLHQRVMWSGQMLLEQMLPPLSDAQTSPTALLRWQRRLEETEPFVVDLAKGPGDPAFDDRAVDPTQIAVPTFCVGGWRDLYAEAMTRLYERLRVPRQLLVGPWMHSLPQDSPFEPVDFPLLALRWWDRWLRDDRSGPEPPPVTLHTMGHRPGWRSHASWPPLGKVLELAATSGSMLAEIPAKSGDDPIAVYEPDPTTGPASGLWGIPNGSLGDIHDQSDEDARAVALTGDPLASELVVCGRPVVTVHLTPEHARVQRVVVRLADVDPQGSSRFVTAGALCPTTPVRTHRVVLRPTAYALAPGHRIRVVVGDSDFPRLTPLPEPVPLRITGVELALPTVERDEGHPVDLPGVHRDVPAPPDGSGWSISRDAPNDEVRVLIRSGVTAVRTPGGHELDTATEMSARVRNDAPGATVATGRHRAVVRTSTGQEVVATATVRCTQADLRMHGELTVDGTTTFAKDWECTLEPQVRAR